jgi:type I restriction enzyme, S subunit
MITALTELGSVARVFNGKTPSKREQRRDGFPVLKIKDVDEFGQFRGTFDPFVESDLANGFPEKIICENDILLLNAAHNADYVAYKSFFVVGSAVGALATGEWMIVRPNPQQLDPVFLSCWLETPSTKKRIAAIVRGIHLYPSDMAELVIQLPPIPEQRRVAKRLAKAGRICRMRRYALQMCDELLPAAFLNMFGDPAINPYSFPIVVGVDLFNQARGGARCGPFGSALKNYEYVPSGIPVWTMENVQSNSFIEDGCLYITEEKFQKLKAYAIQDGDILISRAGTVGRMAIVRTQHNHSIMHSNLVRLALDQTKIIPEYYIVLMTWFGARIAKLKTGQEDAYTFMNTGTLGELPIPLPPIEMQRRFLAFVRSHEQLRAVHVEAFRQADHLFQALLHQAFSEKR